MASEKVKECSLLIAQNGWTITFVESVSAGKMNYEFSTVEESGKILLGGLVCYNATLKEVLLEIPPALIETFTAESAEVTKAMAEHFCRIVPADICVALTGLSTMGGSESAEKPVGTVFIHIIFPNVHIAKRFEFLGDAELIINQAIDSVASEIIREISFK